MTKVSAGAASATSRSIRVPAGTLVPGGGSWPTMVPGSPAELAIDERVAEPEPFGLDSDLGRAHRLAGEVRHAGLAHSQREHDLDGAAALDEAAGTRPGLDDPALVDLGVPPPGRFGGAEAQSLIRQQTGGLLGGQAGELGHGHGSAAHVEIEREIGRGAEHRQQHDSPEQSLHEPYETPRHA